MSKTKSLQTQKIRRLRTKPNKFEDKVLTMIKNLGIIAYHDHGNIDKSDLGLVPTAKSNALELDIVGVIGEIGLIVEATLDDQKHQGKMTHFVNQCKEFVDNSKIPLPDKIKLLKGIPSMKRSDFYKIKEWRFLYVSDSDEIIELRINEQRITNDRRFVVLNKHHYRYLQFLSRNLGEHGKYELLKKLQISFQKAGIKQRKNRYDAIQLSTRKISPEIGFVNLYLFNAPVSDLLQIARVDRYGSLENWIPEIGEESYQRILDKEKLGQIREFINKEGKFASFPNTLTVVINGKKAYVNNQLEIEADYGSFDVIDGQHRLFAFAKSNIAKNDLDNVELLVTGIEFEDASIANVKKWNARTFVEINRTQRKVANDLIYLLQYRVMKENLPSGLATEAITRLNISKKSPLYHLFKTSPLVSKNRKELTPISLVTVANVLKPLFLGVTPKKIPSHKEAQKIIKEKSELIDKFFHIVSNTFNEDWNSPGNTHMFKTHYISSFCILLCGCIEKGIVNVVDMQKVLERLRKNLEIQQSIYSSTGQTKTKMRGPNGELFWNENDGLPIPQNLSGIKKLLLDNANI